MHDEDKTYEESLGIDIVNFTPPTAHTRVKANTVDDGRKIAEDIYR